MSSVYLDYIDNPPIPGGCPILNTAIESDDTHPQLRDRARQARKGNPYNIILKEQY